MARTTVSADDISLLKMGGKGVWEIHKKGLVASLNGLDNKIGANISVRVKFSLKTGYYFTIRLSYDSGLAQEEGFNSFDTEVMEVVDEWLKSLPK